MSFLDGKQERATLLIVLLGIGLAVALWPFSTGLIGAPVLYIMFGPVHRWMSRFIRPGISAVVTIVLAVAVIIVPGAWLLTLLVSQAQDLAQGVFQPELLAKVSHLKLGPVDVGAQLQEIASRVASLLGGWVVRLLGAGTRLILQLTVAFFGLYYLLVDADGAWRALRPFIPFSEENRERLRKRFVDVTASTLIGVFLIGILQGVFLGAAFAVAGLPKALLWGSLTAVASIIPLVGSGLVWVPGALVLAFQGRYVPAVLLAIWMVVVVGNIDNLVRPWVYNRFAKIHPFTTILGAMAGLEFFGLLGILIGPLAISYFFELIDMYSKEYSDTPLPPPPSERAQQPSPSS